MTRPDPYPSPPAVLTVANLKGGSGKTTTAAYAAHALHERGLAVLAVDADPQASLYTWHQAAAFPFACVCLPSARLHREVPGIAGDRYHAVIVDTPPTEHGRTISLSAIRAATHVLVPVAPTGVEFERLRALRTLLDEAADLRPDEAAPPLGVLLVRTVSGAASTAVYRDAMLADGWPVLRATVPRRERYAQSFGEDVRGAGATGYADAVDELLDGLFAPAPAGASA